MTVVENSPVLLVELNVDEFLDSKIVRVEQNTILRFVCGRKALGQHVLLTVTVYDVNHVFPATKSLADLDQAFELVCSKFGSFKYEFFLDKSKVSAGWGYFSVIPKWTIGDQTITLNSLCVCTHLTKLLGPLEEWKERLAVAKNAGYNVIHLTPVQTLGISNSSYSISNFHALNPSLGEGVTFQDLAKLVKFLQNKWSMLTIHDVVWNHAARNSPWLKKYPECSFNCLNSPHLRPAFIIDQALKIFSDEVADLKWEERGIPALFCEEAHVDCMRNVLAQEVLPRLRLHEFFQLDIENTLDLFRKYCSDRKPCPERLKGGLGIIQDPQYRRLSSTINFELAYDRFCYDELTGSGIRRSVDHMVELLRVKLGELNEQKLTYSYSVIDSILNATTGHVRYERVDKSGPRVAKVSKSHPLTANYFVYDDPLNKWEDAEQVAFDKSKGSLAMACNGWVMNNDPLKNFAASDSEVYLRRELVSWGDSIKLNYGKKPEDNPILWGYMQKYTEQCAYIFHGFRIDNAHSTPIHVAEYFLNAARKIRPNLYVVAELFTGSEQLDNLFVNRLGITSLIREAQNAPDSHEQGRFVYRYGGDPVGAFRRKDVRPAPSSVAHALFYDQTHDNPSPATKRTIYDFVPTAAMCSISYCASASSRGYDEFVPFHIHVVHEKRLYNKLHDIVQNRTMMGMIEARRLFNYLHVDLCTKGFSEIFVDQYNEDVVVITRHNPVTHESVILIAHCAFGSFKWKPSGYEHKGIPISGNLSEILFEVKTIEKTNLERTSDGRVCGLLRSFSPNLVGLDNLTVEVREHIPIEKSLAIKFVNNMIMFEDFPSGSVVALKINPKPETLVNWKSINEMISSDKVKKEIQRSIAPLEIHWFNYLFFRCEKEEQVENSSNAYNVPNHGKLVYCGLKGIEILLRKVQETNDLGHPLCCNLREGTWLAEYIVQRLRRYKDLEPLADLIEIRFQPLETMPHPLRPCSFELIFSYIYNAIEEVLIQRLKKISKLPYNVKLIQTLGVLSISFNTSIQDALLPPLFGQDTYTKNPASLAAGLPHFASGIWRNWGRDTALPGLLLSNGRFIEARQLILSFGATLRHGLIPNLLSEGKCPRYNCRDAVWFWLASIIKYIEKSDEGTKILNARVIRLYPTDDAQYTLDKTEILQCTMIEALNRHFKGITFRERNAGPKIDEHMKDLGFEVKAWICRDTGFVYGGNAYNCGTWMDKMGSSDRANNRGFPATPRDGAAVELQGLALYVAEGLAKLYKIGRFVFEGLVDDDVKWTWQEWAQKIRQNFEEKFFVDRKDCSEFVNRKCIVKDSYGSFHCFTDYQLRPNFCIALNLVPDIISYEKSWQALEVAGEILGAPLGICTLDPYDYNYCGNYFNDDDSYNQSTARGWNYHQGPEWLWVASEYLSAKLKVGYALHRKNLPTWKKALDEIKLRIYTYMNYMTKESSYGSLPELTNSRGVFCPGSCESQAWSVGCFIEVLETLDQQLKDVNAD